MRTIWLASYPKSGNTWFRMLVANLSSHDGKPADINDLPERGGIASARATFDHVTMIESGLLTADEIDSLRPRVYEALAHGAEADDDVPETAQTVRFVKAHDAYTRTPEGTPLLAGRSGADGAIVIVRDPRDVAPSLAHHQGSSIDDAIAFMNDSTAAFCNKADRQYQQFRQQLPGWSAHIKSWLDQTDIPVHLIRYEDLQADTTGTLTRALAFAGREASAEAIDRAVRMSAFSALQAQERDKGFRERPHPQRDRQFFRRGLAGGWHDELTTEQTAQLESDHALMMDRLRYPRWPVEFACAG